MKKIFTYIGMTTLVLISFITTEKTITVIKETDEIMIKINEEKSKYEQEPINAKIENNKITPGINGKKINTNKSYEEMKKIGKYNSKKYEYNQIKPKISIEDIYDKYIETGNSNKKEIVIIIIANNKEILKEKEIIKKQNPKVTILKNSVAKKQNNNLTSIQLKDKNQSYCYTQEENDTILKKCAKQKKHTIKINTIKNNLLKEIKNTLSNGKIIAIELNDNTKMELELTINYIKNKGYKIVSPEELLSEKNTN